MNQAGMRLAPAGSSLPKARHDPTFRYNDATCFAHGGRGNVDLVHLIKQESTGVSANSSGRRADFLRL
jgi:hypothetical protein